MIFRSKKFNEFKKKYKLANYISSKSSVINPQKNYENCVVLENSTIQSTATIGKNVFVWANNLIGHHVKVSDNVYISGNCTIAGSSIIGKNSSFRSWVNYISWDKTFRKMFNWSKLFSDKKFKKNSVVVEQSSKVIETKNLDLLNKIIK